MLSTPHTISVLVFLLAFFIQTPTVHGQEKHSLKYRFGEDESIVTQISHLAETETTINGNSQKSSSRTVSLRLWRVLSVAEDGTTKIMQSLRSVDMSQKLPERPVESYNSDKGDAVPRDFEDVANSVGKNLSTITVTTSGEVIDRIDHLPNGVLPGLGQVVMPLPEKPVAIGAKWDFPVEVHIRLENGKFRKINTRQQYTLKAVKTGVATIELKTQVLTPVDDRKVEVQLVQQLTNGTIKFDMVAGHVMSKKINWNETVVGYRGGNSRFKLEAQYDEIRLSKEEVAKRREEAVRR